MKPSICTLAILMLISNSWAQKVSYDGTRKKPHLGAITIVGISSLTIGIGGAIGGLAMEWGAGATYEHHNINSFPDAEAQYQHDLNNAYIVRDIGIVLGVAGLGMTIAGAIHDHSRHRNKWSIVAPKKNEIGFAYNF